MIAIDEFKEFEQRPLLVKMPRDRQSSAVQWWEIKDAQKAEELFGALSVLLHGNPEVGPIMFRPDRGIVAVRWRSLDAAIRAQIYEQLFADHDNDINLLVCETARLINGDGKPAEAAVI